MIHILYKLDKSALHGIGFFADEDVEKGSLIYSASPKLDLNISLEEFTLLSEAEKNEVKYWGFLIEEENVWHVDFDNSKFINHSLDGNATQDTEHANAYLVAKSGIKKGEEVTQNYLEFETKEDLNRRGITE